MLNVQRILVPCDFSDCSRRAVERAAELARWYDAGLTLLHAVPLWPSTSRLPPYVNPIVLEPATRDRLVEELRGLGEPARSLGIVPRCIVREGDPAELVLLTAREQGIDLVVMGRHGDRGFDRWALGSVAEKVVRKAGCPVLTLRLDADTPVPPDRAPFRRVLCGIDFGAASALALRYALALAEEANADLTVAHVIEWSYANDALLPPDLGSRSFQDYVRRTAEAELHAAIPADAGDWCRVTEIVATGRAAPEITRLARERGADLIVLGVHGASTLETMMFGSTARRVLHDAPCPVLTVRSPHGREPGRAQRPEAAHAEH